jgi:hypothetical protein
MGSSNDPPAPTVEEGVPTDTDPVNIAVTPVTAGVLTPVVGEIVVLEEVDPTSKLVTPELVVRTPRLVNLKRFGYVMLLCAVIVRKSTIFFLLITSLL